MAFLSFCWSLVAICARWTAASVPALLQSATARPASHEGLDLDLILKLVGLVIALGLVPWTLRLFRRQLVDNVVGALDTDKMLHDRVAYGLGCLLRNEVVRRQFVQEVVDAVFADDLLHLKVAKGLGRLAHSDELVSQEIIEGLLERMKNAPTQRDRFEKFINDKSVSAQAPPPETDPEEVRARYRQIINAIRPRAPGGHELAARQEAGAGARRAPPRPRQSRKVAAYTSKDRAKATVAPPSRPRRKSPKPKT